MQLYKRAGTHAYRIKHRNNHTVEPSFDFDNGFSTFCKFLLLCSTWVGSNVSDETYLPNKNIIIYHYYFTADDFQRDTRRFYCSRIEKQHVIDHRTHWYNRYGLGIYYDRTARNPPRRGSLAGRVLFAHTRRFISNTLDRLNPYTFSAENARWRCAPAVGRRWSVTRYRAA